MRITGGSAKGQIIKTIPGMSVRPTTDKVREAIFSMLISITRSWKRGLDLFAGSGALGIEALSRDMQWIDFVDQNEKCCQVIKDNLKKTGFIDKSHIYCCSVNKALGFLNSYYDLIFIDPPYADRTIGQLLSEIEGKEIVTADTLVLTAHSSRSPLENRYNTLIKIKEKRYGDTCISIYRKEVTY